MVTAEQLAQRQLERDQARASQKTRGGTFNPSRPKSANQLKWEADLARVNEIVAAKEAGQIDVKEAAKETSRIIAEPSADAIRERARNQNVSAPGTSSKSFANPNFERGGKPPEPPKPVKESTAPVTNVGGARVLTSMLDTKSVPEDGGILSPRFVSTPENKNIQSGKTRQEMILENRQERRDLSKLLSSEEYRGAEVDIIVNGRVTKTVPAEEAYLQIVKATYTEDGDISFRAYKTKSDRDFARNLILEAEEQKSNAIYIYSPYQKVGQKFGTDNIIGAVPKKEEEVLSALSKSQREGKAVLFGVIPSETTERNLSMEATNPISKAGKGVFEVGIEYGKQLTSESAILLRTGYGPGEFVTLTPKERKPLTSSPLQVYTKEKLPEEVRQEYARTYETPAQKVATGKQLNLKDPEQLGAIAAEVGIIAYGIPFRSIVPIRFGSVYAIEGRGAAVSKALPNVLENKVISLKGTTLGYEGKYAVGVRMKGSEGEVYNVTRLRPEDLKDFLQHYKPYSERGMEFAGLTKLTDKKLKTKQGAKVLAELGKVDEQEFIDFNIKGEQFAKATEKLKDRTLTEAEVKQTFQETPLTGDKKVNEQVRQVLINVQNPKLSSKKASLALKKGDKELAGYYTTFSSSESSFPGAKGSWINITEINKFNKELVAQGKSKDVVPVNKVSDIKDLDFDLKTEEQSAALLGILQREVKTPKGYAFGRSGLNILYGKETSFVFPTIDISKDIALHGGSKQSVNKLVAKGPTISPDRRFFTAKVQDLAVRFSERAKKREGSQALAKVEYESRAILKFGDLSKSVQLKIRPSTRTPWDVFQRNLAQYAKQKGYLGYEKPYKVVNPKSERQEVVFFAEGAIKSIEEIKPVARSADEGVKFLNLLGKDDELNTELSKFSSGKVFGRELPYEEISHGGFKTKKIEFQAKSLLKSITSGQTKETLSNFETAATPEIIKGTLARFGDKETIITTPYNRLKDVARLHSIGKYGEESVKGKPGKIMGEFADILKKYHPYLDWKAIEIESKGIQYVSSGRSGSTSATSVLSSKSLTSLLSLKNIYSPKSSFYFSSQKGSPSPKSTSITSIKLSTSSPLIVSSISPAIISTKSISVKSPSMMSTKSPASPSAKSPSVKSLSPKSPLSPKSLVSPKSPLSPKSTKSSRSPVSPRSPISPLSPGSLLSLKSPQFPATRVFRDILIGGDVTSRRRYRQPDKYTRIFALNVRNPFSSSLDIIVR